MNDVSLNVTPTKEIESGGKFFLYGAGGHAKVVLDILRTLNVVVDCVCDDDSCLTEFYGVPMVSGERSPVGTAVVCVGDNEKRREIVVRLKKRGYVKFSTAVVHPNAIISGKTKIGEGTVIMPGGVVNVGTTIGNHCIVNTGASVDHDCFIGDFSHVAPHATLCGGVSVGCGSWIGAGAVVVQGVSIGENCLVGAGAVVIRDVPANAVVAGVPAKVLKYRTPPPNNLIAFPSVPAGELSSEKSFPACGRERRASRAFSSERSAA